PCEGRRSSAGRVPHQITQMGSASIFPNVLAELGTQRVFEYFTLNTQTASKHSNKERDDGNRRCFQTARGGMRANGGGSRRLGKGSSSRTRSRFQALCGTGI